MLNNECIICVLINVAVFEAVSIAYSTLNLRWVNHTVNEALSGSSIETRSGSDNSLTVMLKDMVSPNITKSVIGISIGTLICPAGNVTV